MTIEANDLIFDVQGDIFDVRASGIIKFGDKILLHRSRENLALIGGKQKMDESSTTAVIREYREELHVTVVPERLLWIMDHQFIDDQQKHQQIQLVHLMKLASDVLPPDTFTVGQHTFEWVKLADLKAKRVYPLWLRKVSELPSVPVYMNDVFSSD
ncbi:NUDIX hydrolase [Furfurilactobacillus siliginis]|uniref:DNA mismatch repair protein MutT n=1 Tax=Furfurilactobacillus siliginis TaxID=348151 RepID=A0A0R2L525_9LACO|nr:NUDIX domain-containing protein [Furfurilactobacillus siliginis]KRN96464.1 hypothetical protein IV55_GL001436 [Furfurilactobacillus siliginis]GEK28903.1 DNA mismatch repair protein MutT [Furfurilactobacillus siliginis]